MRNGGQWTTVGVKERDLLGFWCQTVVFGRWGSEGKGWAWFLHKGVIFAKIDPRKIEINSKWNMIKNKLL